jgi:hypothetical protein
VSALAFEPLTTVKGNPVTCLDPKPTQPDLLK